MNIKQSLNNKCRMIRLQARVSKEAINEIWRNRKNTKPLSEYTHEGICYSCHEITQVINKTNTCLNCVFKKPELRINNPKLKNNTHPGVCSCGYKGLIDNEFNECLNCYAKNKRGGI